MYKKTISVIVPVYNVEPYLEDCVNSILRQSYKNLEIILIDDGSSDNSGRICDEYGNKDSRIKVVHKENGGLSDARNCGLSIATGEILSFIDSDDYISEFFYEIMVKVMQDNDCDIVALKGGTDFWDGSYGMEKLLNHKADYKYTVDSAENILRLMLYQKIATGAPFKIYKKELFDGVLFPVSWLYEDVATTYKTFLRADKVAVVDADLYAYRKRRDSIIRQPFSDKKLTSLFVFEQLLNDEDLARIGMHKAAASRVYAMLYSVFLQIPKDRKEVRMNVWEKLKSVRQLIIFDNCPLVRKKNRYGAIISVFGMNASYYLGRRFGQKGSFN